MKDTKESLQIMSSNMKSERPLPSEKFNAQVQAQSLLQSGNDLMSDTLRIVNTFRPFDLSVEIKATLSDLKNLTNPYTSLKRWLYRLPILGIYFSPIKMLHQQHLKILAKIERLNNLLKAQNVQITQKVLELTKLSKKTIELEFITKQLLNHTAFSVKEDLARPAKLSQQTAQSYSVLLKTNLHALTLHDIQLQRSIASISDYLTEINKILYEITPLWHQQLKLTEVLIARKERLKIINTDINKHLPQTIYKRETSNGSLSEMTLNNAESSFQNIFDLNASTMLESETIEALEAILVTPTEIKSAFSLKKPQ